MNTLNKEVKICQGILSYTEISPIGFNIQQKMAKNGWTLNSIKCSEGGAGTSPCIIVIYLFYAFTCSITIYKII